MQVGGHVMVANLPGVLALDNKDGTWNVKLDDGNEVEYVPAEFLSMSANHSLVLSTGEPQGLASWAPAGARLVSAPWDEPKPEAWTRFVCFSDTHGLHDEIPKEHKPSADVLLHAGDFTNTGELEQVESLNKWLQAYPAAEKIVIAGNHDVTFHEEYYRKTGATRFHRGCGAYDCTKAKALLTKASACTYLEDSSIEVRGYRIYGSPWQPEFCDWAFNLPKGAACRKCWEAIPAELDILVTHGPPFGRGDRCSPGHRAGCEELLTAIKARKVSVNIFGHIHEAYGCSADEVTLFVNASTCTEGYRPSNAPIVFDLPPPAELRKATATAVAAVDAAGSRS